MTVSDFTHKISSVLPTFSEIDLVPKSILGVLTPTAEVLAVLRLRAASTAALEACFLLGSISLLHALLPLVDLLIPPFGLTILLYKNDTSQITV